MLAALPRRPAGRLRGTLAARPPAASPSPAGSSTTRSASLVPACDALVFPSTFPEAFGMVAAEAAAAGRRPGLGRPLGRRRGQPGAGGRAAAARRRASSRSTLDDGAVDGDRRRGSTAGWRSSRTLAAEARGAAARDGVAPLELGGVARACSRRRRPARRLPVPAERLEPLATSRATRRAERRRRRSIESRAVTRVDLCSAVRVDGRADGRDVRPHDPDPLVRDAGVDAGAGRSTRC